MGPASTKSQVQNFWIIQKFQIPNLKILDDPDFFGNTAMYRHSGTLLNHFQWANLMQKISVAHS